MQDPRIRLLCAFLLSLAAFASVTGALAVVIWWLAGTGVVPVAVRKARTTAASLWQEATIVDTSLVT